MLLTVIAAPGELRTFEVSTEVQVQPVVNCQTCMKYSRRRCLRRVLAFFVQIRLLERKTGVIHCCGHLRCLGLRSLAV